MNDSESRNVLYAALFLIILALVAIGLADHWNWRDLAGAGGIVLGYGGGILQGKSMTQTTTKGGGDIVVNPPQDSPKA